MLRMLDRLDLKDTALHLVYSNGDEFSLQRATKSGVASKARAYAGAYAVPRARHVGQPIYKALGGAISAFWSSLGIMYSLRPRVLLCNGPGTCVMLVLAMRTLTLLGLVPRARVVYIESFARVSGLSLTGKLLLHIADEFVVQWPPLHAQYPQTRYLGLLV